MMKLKEKLTTKYMKKGSYSLGSIFVLLAILIVMNMVVAKIPTKYTQIDVSANQLYTIGEQTEEVLSLLEEDVTLYYITESGSTEDAAIRQLLGRYEGASSHITVTLKDVVANPTFVEQYTDTQVAANSIIVVSEGRSKVIPYENMYMGELNYTIYSYTTTGFDGEGQITSAIAYVTSEDLPVVYNLTGHNEAAISAALQAAIEKENLELKELSLLTKETVPEDADILMISGPTTDISEDEADKIITFLEGGGKALILSASSVRNDMTNFNSVLAAYGVQTVEGVVLEGNSNYHYPNYMHYLIPTIRSHDATATALETGYVMLPLAQGIEILDNTRSTLTIETLLETSSSAYSKVDIDNAATTEKESGDIEGPFILAAAITETYNGAQTQIVYIACDAMLDENVDAAVSGGNTNLLVGSLSWMSNHEVPISIAEKSLSIEYLTLTAGSVNFWGAVTTAILPLFFVLCGGIIWFRRRRA